MTDHATNGLAPTEWCDDSAPADRLGYVLLDRDGVVNVDRAASVTSPTEFEFEAGARAALAKLHSMNFGTIVVTNQAAVGRNRLTLQGLSEIHDHFVKESEAAGGRIDAIYCCPHAPEDNCDCRKPKTGLILAATRKFGFDPGETWMVGDDLRDVQAAHAAGVRPALVLTGKGRMHKNSRMAPIFGSLREFVDALGSGA